MAPDSAAHLDIGWRPRPLTHVAQPDCGHLYGSSGRQMHHLCQDLEPWRRRTKRASDCGKWDTTLARTMKLQKDVKDILWEKEKAKHIVEEVF